MHRCPTEGRKNTISFDLFATPCSVQRKLSFAENAPLISAQTPKSFICRVPGGDVMGAQRRANSNHPTGDSPSKHFGGKDWQSRLLSVFLSVCLSFQFNPICIRREAREEADPKGRGSESKCFTYHGLPLLMGQGGAKQRNAPSFDTQGVAGRGGAWRGGAWRSPERD